MDCSLNMSGRSIFSNSSKNLFFTSTRLLESDSPLLSSVVVVVVCFVSNFGNLSFRIVSFAGILGRLLWQLLVVCRFCAFPSVLHFAGETTKKFSAAF